MPLYLNEAGKVLLQTAISVENTSKKFRKLKEKAMAELRPKGPQPVQTPD